MIHKNKKLTDKAKPISILNIDILRDINKSKEVNPASRRTVRTSSRKDNESYNQVKSRYFNADVKKSMAHSECTHIDTQTSTDNYIPYKTLNTMHNSMDSFEGATSELKTIRLSNLNYEPFVNNSTEKHKEKALKHHVSHKKAPLVFNAPNIAKQDFFLNYNCNDGILNNKRHIKLKERVVNFSHRSEAIMLDNINIKIT